MPFVTDSAENKWSPFEAHNLKMFYILHNRLHCHSNVTPDCFVLYLCLCFAYMPTSLKIYSIIVVFFACCLITK